MKHLNFLLLAGLLFAIPFFWNSCMTDECTGPSTRPKNIVAVPGNGQVTLSWDLDSASGGTGSSAGLVSSEVRYPTDGGAGENCNAEKLPANCAVACPSSQGLSSCTATGLTNGKAYAFTIVTSTVPGTLDCGFGKASARSDTVTPKMN